LRIITASVTGIDAKIARFATLHVRSDLAASFGPQGCYSLERIGPHQTSLPQILSLASSQPASSSTTVDTHMAIHHTICQTE
jgi:hypothetical protein